jgi:DNA-binding NtrC family response regulator
MSTVLTAPSVIATGDGSDRPAAVLYVQASPRQRPGVSERLARTGLATSVAHDIADALRLLGERRFTLVLLDLAQERAALTAVRLLRARYPGLPLAALVDVAHPAVAAEAMHAGVTDLLPWPFEDQDLTMLALSARDRSALDPARGLARTAPATALFVQSPAMRQVMEQVRAAAANRQHVCVCGEHASGRELVARAMHALGGGSDDGFIAVECEVESPQDLEHELFGTMGDPADVEGAGAERLTAESAILRAASGGTLFLADVTEAPARVQAKLARLLRDREASLPDRRGVIDLDVRVIAATAPDLDASVTDGRLRRDLADRLTHVRIDVPPLRRRREDIPLLVVHFARRLSETHQLPGKTFSRSALALLSALPWQGNAAELWGLIEVLVRSVRRSVIQLEDVLEHTTLDGLAARIDTGMSLRDAKARFERECISAVLIRHHGRVGEAAKALGIQRTNLYRKVRQLNVSRALLSARR